jgi:hypothetical protein
MHVYVYIFCIEYLSYAYLYVCVSLCVQPIRDILRTFKDSHVTTVDASVTWDDMGRLVPSSSAGGESSAAGEDEPLLQCGHSMDRLILIRVRMAQPGLARSCWY